MFDHVLIPVDPRDADQVVAEYGIQVADAFASRVTVLTVIEGREQRDQIRVDQEEDARETVEDILQHAGTHDLRADGDVRHGMPAEEILSILGETDIDLVVMGTQARTGVDRFLLGSVAEEVIREAPEPVLTITPEAEPVVHS